MVFSWLSATVAVVHQALDEPLNIQVCFANGAAPQNVTIVPGEMILWVRSFTFNNEFAVSH